MEEAQEENVIKLIFTIILPYYLKGKNTGKFNEVEGIEQFLFLKWRISRYNK